MEITFAISASAGGALERISQGAENSANLQEIGSSALTIGALAVMDLIFLTDFFKNQNIEWHQWIIPAAVGLTNFFALKGTLFKTRE